MNRPANEADAVGPEQAEHVTSVDRAWMAEARRRYEAILLGEAKVIDHEEVVRRLTARFRNSVDER